MATTTVNSDHYDITLTMIMIIIIMTMMVSMLLTTIAAPGKHTESAGGREGTAPPPRPPHPLTRDETSDPRREKKKIQKIQSHTHEHAYASGLGGRSVSTDRSATIIQKGVETFLRRIHLGLDIFEVFCFCFCCRCRVRSCCFVSVFFPVFALFSFFPAFAVRLLCHIYIRLEFSAVSFAFCPLARACDL